MGPLYTIVAENKEGNVLVSAGSFSVTKINQMLSAFVAMMWLLVFAKSLGPMPPALKPDLFKIGLTNITAAALGALFVLGRTTIGHGTSRLKQRTFDIET